MRRKFGSCLEANNFLPSRQFGFRSSRGTADKLLFAYYDVAKLVDEGKVVDIAYLNFHKAFDLVCHEFLLKKTSCSWI